MSDPDELTLWCATCGLTYPVVKATVDRVRLDADEWPTGVLQAACLRCPERLMVTVWPIAGKWVAA